MANNDKTKEFYLTPEGLKNIEEELAYLTTTKRQEVAQMIAEAKAEGDISENAGYDEAKTAQGFLEGKIRDLENVLKHSVIIEENEGPANAVDIGRTVVIREVGTTFDEEYTIVGSMEADPVNGRISNASPMGKALLSKHIGDEVLVESPGGEIAFEIVSIN